jgi:HK97 family phage portal protein
MKLFGFEVTFQKTANAIQSYYTGYGNWFGGLVNEPFAGAWQKNVVCESRQNILAFATVYRCVALISGDVSKNRLKLMEQDSDGIWSEVLGISPYKQVLVKPNDYQTRQQFLSQWLVSKLLYGNTYVYIQRDLRGIATALHVLDPRLVTVKLTETGVVFYQLATDTLSGVKGPLGLSADDIMHDRCACLFHPLIGVSPIYAAAASATQGIRIQNQSAQFFENMSRPSGILSTPDKITDAVAEDIKKRTEAALTGGKIGRLLVVGDGLKYEALTMPATDAQLIEQLQWTERNVAAAFGVPLHKVGAGEDQKFANIAALNQDYYNQTLQEYIEAIESLFDDRIGVANVTNKTYGIEIDLEGLLRMDPISRADRLDKLVKAGVLAPNEGRKSENLKPVTGGDSPMIQQQQFSLEALAKRDAKPDPFATTAPAPKAALPAPTPEPQPDAAKDAMNVLRLRVKQNLAA